MDAETVSHIFDPFFTTREIGEGTGLGLSTVFGIVRDHEGGISVSSEPGQGATFEIFLPAAKSSSATQRLPASRLPVTKGAENILFIDDEEVIAKLGKRSLENFGYRVTAFTDSSKALKVFRANPNRFDLVVTDQSMPKMTGEQLVPKLRKIRDNIPIILCTGHSSTMTPESSNAIGINAFLIF